MMEDQDKYTFKEYLQCLHETWYIPATGLFIASGFFLGTYVNF